MRLNRILPWVLKTNMLASYHHSALNAAEDKLAACLAWESQRRILVTQILTSITAERRDVYTHIVYEIFRNIFKRTPERCAGFIKNSKAAFSTNKKRFYSLATLATWGKTSIVAEKTMFTRNELLQVLRDGKSFLQKPSTILQ